MPKLTILKRYKNSLLGISRRYYCKSSQETIDATKHVVGSSLHLSVLTLHVNGQKAESSLLVDRDFPAPSPASKVKGRMNR